jgi:hypothetical protein
MAGEKQVSARWRSAFIALACAPVLLLACDATRRDWESCEQESCQARFVCTTDHRCVPAAALDGGALDLATAPEVAPALLDGEADGPPDTPTVETASEAPPPVAIDAAAADVVIDAPPGPGLDAELDGAADAPIGPAPDTRVPDAPGTCSSDGDCAGPTPYCVENRCVACRTSEACPGGSPICSPDHACVSCALADGGCPATAPACEADSGRCVECVSNDGCTLATKPICDSATNTCVPCTRDEQCAGRGPGVCMFHLDGRCAADAETVYVSEAGAAVCSDSASNAGSAEVPYCTAQKGVLAARAKGRPLVVLAGALAGGFTGIALTAPLTVVGKNAIVTPAEFADGIGINSGELYLRGLSVTGSATLQTGIGINAQATAGASLVLHMEACIVTGNPGGGILLGGAAFDIRNTRVAGNGPGETGGGTSFGGIRVDSLPQAGSTRLELVTLEDNLAPGLSCAGSITGSGVLAAGNTVLDIASSCGVVSCATAGPTCGAQP